MNTGGQILRLTGLLIEMLGIWAVLKLDGSQGALRLHLPGGSSLPIGLTAVGLGFMVWLVGTIMASASRSRRKPDPHDEEEREP